MNTVELAELRNKLKAARQGIQQAGAHPMAGVGPGRALLVALELQQQVLEQLVADAMGAAVNGG